jgi:uncharacterized damage-inducible protein DinB
MDTRHVQLLARYNRWMNHKLYDACAGLSAQALAQDRGAFFGSILGTLNHLVVTDTMWLRRFAQLPARHPQLDPIRALPVENRLDAILFTGLAPLRERSALIDAALLDWTAVLTEDDLSHCLHYANSKGVESEREVRSLLLHLFNHQTHHRGQATTLLSQAGAHIDVTDLLVLLPDRLAQDEPPTP